MTTRIGGLPRWARGAVEAMDAGRVGHEDRIGAADEQPAFHHADDAPDAFLQSRRIGDAAEIAVENAVAAVGDEGRARRRLRAVERWRRALRATRLGRFQSEGDHLHGNRGVRPKPVHQLAAVDDDREAVARRRDDLLAQQRAAQSLDQIERAALDLVRTVDREIDLAMLAERGERNARRLRLRRRTLRGGNADEAQALPMTPRRALRPQRPPSSRCQARRPCHLSTNCTAASAAARLRASRSRSGRKRPRS